MLTNQEDVIASIITSPGNAGVGIIRVSGKDSILIIQQFFFSKNNTDLSKQKSHTIHHGWFKDSDKLIDEVLICLFKGPHSYTAENVVEIQSHGNYLILKIILDILVNKTPIRLSQPGEFTQRAFLNGRIDLTKAEAVNDLLQARSTQSIDQAINHLKGKLYDKINGYKEDIAWILALSNAGIDFPEEDVVFSHQGEILEKLKAVQTGLEYLVLTSEQGRVIREGLQIALIGTPNVGKSSLMNLFLKESRSIVTDIAGTTRDSIEDSFSIDGLLIHIIDTAGVRDTEDIIEKEGVQRTLSSIKKADLILWIIDSENLDFENIIISTLENKAKFIVFNKSDVHGRTQNDIPKLISFEDWISVSAKKKSNIEMLERKIYDFAINQNVNSDGILLTNLRQKLATIEASSGVLKAMETLEAGFGEEYLAVDLHAVLECLGEIVGETTTDDMLNKIFENFCIGK